MSEPTVASRLQRRCLLLTTDAAIIAALRAAVPAGWQLNVAASPEEAGDFAEILQHRFVLLDLDDAAIDPLDAIGTLRGEMMLNIPVIGIGGSPALRDAARIARADRFFSRTEAAAVLRQFCSQFDW